MYKCFFVNEIYCIHFLGYGNMRYSIWRWNIRSGCHSGKCSRSGAILGHIQLPSICRIWQLFVDAASSKACFATGTCLFSRKPLLYFFHWGLSWLHCPQTYFNVFYSVIFCTMNHGRYRTSPSTDNAVDTARHQPNFVQLHVILKSGV